MSKEKIKFLFNVKDLKEYLKDIPDETKLITSGVDLDGYECSWIDFVNPEYNKNGKELILSHRENQLFREAVASDKARKLYEKYFEGDKFRSRY